MRFGRSLRGHRCSETSWPSVQLRCSHGGTAMRESLWPQVEPPLRQQDHAADRVPVLGVAGSSGLGHWLRRAGRSPFLPAPAVVAMRSGKARRRWCRRRFARLGQIPWRRHRPLLVAMSHRLRVANRLPSEFLLAAIALCTATTRRQCERNTSQQRTAGAPARRTWRSRGCAGALPWRGRCTDRCCGTRSGRTGRT